MKKNVMKKVMFLLIIISIGRISYASDYGIMWAEKYPIAFFNFFIADHTYVCGRGRGCYALHGGNSGGTYLSGTWGIGDRDKMKCVAKKKIFWGIKICKVIWGFEGVCHQEANRMLYTNGKKVTRAKGYWIFYPLYGHYGNIKIKWKYCKKKCRL